MDIFQLLKQDHSKVKGLFEELEQTTEKAIKTRERLFETLNEDLTLHAEMEEKLFYPRIKEEEETHELTVEAIEEHLVVKKLLKELETEPKDTEEWAAKAKVLMENVRHHIQEEEGELFKKCRKVLSKEDTEAMAEEAEEFKAAAKAG